MVIALTTTAGPAAAEPPALPEITPEYLKEAATFPIDFEDGRYIVQLESDPISTYEGGEAGIEATAPDEGETIDFTDSEVAEYRDFLADERTEVIAEHDIDATSEYDTVLNGFSADLTAAEAEELAASDKVAAVIPETMYQPTTADTPDFLGLSGWWGSWRQEFWSPKRAGEGVIVGVLDTGIWPENPSLAPLSEPRPDQDVIDAKWNGECDSGEEADPADNVECNNKLIGARWFDAWGSAENGYASPRDEDGHGTHTATTAAGNYRTDVEIDGQDFGEVSGMAPAARVAAYKVCWGGCPGADLVAGIEAAVNDGVDVINFSIGSTGTAEFVDAVSIAFFNAAAAGVFVAASAGNDGPTSTVDHQEPWVTTVAASTHDRAYRSTLTFGGNDAKVAGAFGAAEWPVKNAVDAAYDDADPAAAATCDANTLDPAKTEGYAIICVRGNLFTDNANQVDAAGGLALIVRDQSDRGPATVVTSQRVPVVHVAYEDGLALADWVAAEEDPVVEVETSDREWQNAPSMAAFSSNGPGLAAGQNLLKPDITAPGVEILAGITPDNHGGNDYAALQGTSMSSPHIAGLAALLVSANPEWSPMAVKSAIMTTAYQTDANGDPIQRGGADATPFDYGAGHVDGREMFDPGLVYESEPTDWIQYICGTAEAHKVQSNCDALGSIDPSQLNYPSITVAELTGTYEVTRTVTNVSKWKGTYKAEITAPEGFEVTSDVTKFKLKPGESKTYTLTITRTDAAFGEWAFGDITWVEKLGRHWTLHEVRSPIVVKPTQLAAADEVSFTDASGSATIEGNAGFEGTLGASVSGLVASEVKSATLTDPDSSSFPTDNPAENSHVVSYEFATPADAALVRFATFDAEHPTGTDLDLFVYVKNADDSLTLVGASAAGGTNETVTLPGGYTFVVFVDEWAGPSPLETKLHAWVVPGSDEGNLAVDPAEQAVTMGGEFSLDLTWSGLAEGRRFLGTVDFTQDGEAIDTTVVGITT